MELAFVEYEAVAEGPATVQLAGVLASKIGDVGSCLYLVALFCLSPESTLLGI